MQNARSIFWGAQPVVAFAPAGAVRYPLVNMGRRGPRMSGFLGQEAAAPPAEAVVEQPNRLELVPVSIIRDRILLVLTVDKDGKLPANVEEARKRFSDSLTRSTTGARYSGTLDVSISGWNDQDLGILLDVAKAPTESELRDLSLVDGIYGTSIPEMARGRLMVSASPYRQLDAMDSFRLLACTDVGAGGMEGQSAFAAYRGREGAFDVAERAVPWSTAGGEGVRRSRYGKIEEGHSPLKSNPFFCTPVVDVGFPKKDLAYHATPASFFGISDGEEWGEAKPVVRNMIPVMQTMSSYPWPSPISAIPGIWMQLAKNDLQGIVRMKGSITPELARFIITLLVLQYYNDASERIVRELKRRAKKKKRSAIIKAIALAVVSIVVAIALPAAIALGIAAIQTAMSIKETQDAARDMKKAAKQFAETDTAFSAELDRASEILDSQAAREEADKPLTSEEAEAIAEARAEGSETADITSPIPAPEISEGPPVTDLLIGGGIAAGAVALLAFLR